MCMCVSACMNVCAPHECGGHEGQKRAKDPTAPHCDEPFCVCWKSNQDTLEKHPTFLTFDQTL